MEMLEKSLKKKFTPIIILISFYLLLIFMPNTLKAQEGDVYLKRERDRYFIGIDTKNLDFNYSLFGKEGEITIVIENWVSKEHKKIDFKDAPIRSIEISPKDKKTFIKVITDHNYILKCKKEKTGLLCELSKGKNEDYITLRLNEYMYKDECEKFIDDYRAIRSNLYKVLSKDDLIRYEKFLLDCADRGKDFDLFLEASNYIQSLGYNLDPATKIKKINLLYRLKRYRDVVTEGGILLSELRGKPEEYTVAITLMDALITLGERDRVLNMIKGYDIMKIPEKYRAGIIKIYGKLYYNSDLYFASYLYLKKAMGLDPYLIKMDNLALFQLGLSAYKLKKYDEAIRYLLLAVNLHPDMIEESGEALYIIGTIHKDKGETDKALWIFNQTSILFPNTKGGALSKLNLAIYKKKDKPSEAIRELQAILSLYKYPDVRELALYNLAECYELLDKDEDAIKTYKQFLSEFPKSSLYKNAYDAIKKLEYKGIEKAFNENRLEEAVVRASNFLKEYKDDPLAKDAYEIAKKAINKILENYITQKNCPMISKIWREYNNMIDIDVKNGTLAFEMVKCIYPTNSTGAITIAEHIFTNLFKQFPNKEELINLLAKDYITNSKYQKLENLTLNYNGFMDKNILNDAIYKLANWNYINKNIDKLEKLSNIKNVSSKNLSYIDYLLITWNLENKNFKKAMEILRKNRLLENLPEKDEKIRMIIARELIDQGNYKEAMNLLTRIVNTYPRGKYTDEALFLLGYYSKNPKIKSMWWDMLEKNYKESPWYKELQAIKLAEETQEWAKKVISNR